MPTEIRSDIRETVLRAEGPDLGPTRISAAEETPAYTGRQPLRPRSRGVGPGLSPGRDQRQGEKGGVKDVVQC